MIDYLSIHWLDILTTVLGLVYLLLEYRASIALWLVGIIMPAMDVYLYWTHGLYGDAGMETMCQQFMATPWGSLAARVDRRRAKRCL